VLLSTSMSVTIMLGGNHDVTQSHCLGGFVGVGALLWSATAQESGEKHVPVPDAANVRNVSTATA
jgi:hypothetical protein